MQYLNIANSLLRSKRTRRFYREPLEEGGDIVGFCLNTLERLTSKLYKGHAHKLPIRFCIISFFGVVNKFRQVNMAPSKQQRKQHPLLLLNLSHFHELSAAQTTKRKEKIIIVFLNKIFYSFYTYFILQKFFTFNILSIYPSQDGQPAQRLTPNVFFQLIFL